MPVPDAYRSTMSPLELLSVGGGVDRTRRARHRDPRRRVSPPGRAGTAGGDARPSLGWPGRRRVERRLVEGRARPDGCRVHDPRPADGRTRGRDARLVGGRTPCSSRVSSSRSRRRSSAPNRCSQAGPPLLSGMRSPAGLRRTAELFDVWNPASGSIEQIMATAAEIDTLATVASAAHPSRATDLHRAAVRRRGPPTDDGRPDGGSSSRRPRCRRGPCRRRHGLHDPGHRPRRVDHLPRAARPAARAAADDQPG